jgi:hypothetical protein
MTVATNPSPGKPLVLTDGRASWGVDVGAIWRRPDVDSVRIGSVKFHQVGWCGYDAGGGSRGRGGGRASYSRYANGDGSVIYANKRAEMWGVIRRLSG